MNLDEAIEHASEKAKDKNVCEECRKDHEQLAGWLEELRERRNAKVDSSAIVDALCQCDLFLANVTKHAHPKPVPGDECVACAGAGQLRAQVGPVLTQALIAARMNRADASKMRWALEFVRGELLGVINGGSTSSLKCLTVIENALVDSPARNCDVGTPDEQAERFEAECKRYDHCTPCPIYAAWGEFREGKPKSCQLIWAQMPFAQPKGEVK